MGREMTVKDSVVVKADAGLLYEQIADPSQMRRWSPENTGAIVPAPGRPLVQGDKFRGSNKRGGFKWSTNCVVVDAQPGRRFAFAVRAIGIKGPFIPGRIATWAYEFEPVEGGTRVTEVWKDDRKGWPDSVAARFDRTATRGSLFSEFQRKNIARTLARLKADFES